MAVRRKAVRRKAGKSKKVSSSRSKRVTKKRSKKTERKGYVRIPVPRPPSLMQRPDQPLSVLVGCWATICGVFACIMLALLGLPQAVPVFLALGLVLGVLNIDHEETIKFMVTYMALLLIGVSGIVIGFSKVLLVKPLLAAFIALVSLNLIALIAPATLLVVLKSLFELTKR